MGVLTDFVVAPRPNAVRVGEASVPSEEFGGIDAKGIDQVRMGTLYAILSGTYDPTFLVDEASFVYSASDDGPWVQVIPEDMGGKVSHDIERTYRGCRQANGVRPRSSNLHTPAGVMTTFGRFCMISLPWLGRRSPKTTRYSCGPPCNPTNEPRLDTALHPTSRRSQVCSAYHGISRSCGV